MLVKLLGDLGARTNGVDKYVAVALDSGKATFRHDLYAAYKQNRPPPPELLVPQFPIIRQAIEAFNIPILEEPGFEADDLIATYAAQARRKGLPVTIISSDKDLMQLLVDDGIELLDGIKFVTYQAPFVQEKYGVAPRQLTDLFALIGDASDNVPGVPGVGPKTAATLIQEYDSLENIYANIHGIPKKLKSESLLTFKDQAFLSRQLITLRYDAPMPVSLADMRPVHLSYSDTLMHFLERMELQQLAKRILSLKPPSSTVSERKSPIMTDPENLQVACQRIFEQGHFTFQISSPQAITLNQANVALTVQTIPILRQLFASPAVLAIGHDVKSALHILRQHQIACSTFDDVMLMAYSADCGLLKDYTLDSLYAYYEASDLLQLWQTLKKHLLVRRATRVYHVLERPMVPILARMEEVGICVDRAYLEVLSHQFETRLQNIQADIMQQVGMPFNLASPKQLGEVLFEKLGYVSEGKTKTGVWRTDSEVLENLAAQGVDLAEKILSWRMITKLKNTYTDPLLKLAHSETGRVHPTFLLASTHTGRLACTTPNVQNIPIRTPEGQSVRQCFVAKKDHLLLWADYNQIELRLLAHIADVPALKKAFSEGVDVHTLTASQIFDKAPEDIDASLRRKAKATNFGIIYGLSAFGLARQLSIEQGEAKRIIDHYFQRFPQIQTYIEATCAQLYTHGFVETLMGRKIYFPPRLAHFSQTEKKAFERAAINAPIQGSAADVIRLSMEKLCHYPMLLQIHDELLFEVPRDGATEMAQSIQYAMEHAHDTFIDLSVPLTVETHLAPRWGI